MAVDQWELDEYRYAASSLAEHAETHRQTSATIDSEWNLPYGSAAMDEARQAWARAEIKLAEAQEEFRRTVKRRLDELIEGPR